MATAVKRGGSYKITASCGYDISGKQIRKHTTWTPPVGMTPRQIAKELERQKVLFEERVNSGTTKDGNIRFEDFAAIWMKDFAQKQLKIKTYTGYEKSLERINQAIGHIKLKDLRTGHLNEFYRNLEETGIRADLKYTSKIDIGEAIKQAGVTRTAFGKAAGVAGNTLRIAISGKRVSKETAMAISAELSLKLSDAFRLEQPDRLLPILSVPTIGSSARASGRRSNGATSPIIRPSTPNCRRCRSTRRHIWTRQRLASC